jgi:hypothetical protein
MQYVVLSALLKQTYTLNKKSHERQACQKNLSAISVNLLEQVQMCAEGCEGVHFSKFIFLSSC